jgi:hypothetical protein
MAHQVDPQLHQLAQAQPGNLHNHIFNIIYISSVRIQHRS